MAGNLHFLTVNKHSESHVISFVKDAFSQRSDEKATDSVLDSDDWRCEVFLATASSPAAPVPLGFVVYKLKPTDEYSRLGLTNSVEIKALYLADPSKTRGKGYRSFMLSRVVNYARSIASSGVHTIVPDIKSDLSTFFLDKKFKDLGFLPSSHDEAPDKLYALRLSGNDKEIHNKVHHSEVNTVPPRDSPPRKNRREDSEIGKDVSGDSFPHKLREDEPEAPGAVSRSGDSLSRKRQRADDSERDTAATRDYWPKRLRQEESNQCFGRKKPWRLPLRQPYLQWIKEGKKTVEGRINTGLPARFRAGDEVVFFGGPNSVTVQVTKVDSFKSFHDMLQSTSVGKCLPDYAHRPLDDAVRLYRSFPGYADKERQHGVLAIHITCVPSN